MRLPFWIEGNDDYSANPLPDIALPCSALNICTVEGTGWRGVTIPGVEITVNGVAGLTDFRDYCREIGVHCQQHNVPRGEDTEAEADALIEALRVVPYVLIDYEENPGGIAFWTRETSPGSGVTDRAAIIPYMQRIRAARPDDHILVAIPSHTGAGPEEIRNNFLPYVDGFYYYAYWGPLGGVDGPTELNAIYNVWRAEFPTLEAGVLMEASDTNEARTISNIQLARRLNLNLNVWRRGILADATKAAIVAASTDP